MNKRSISLILIIVFSLCIVMNTAQPSLALSTEQTDALNAYYKILSSFEWKSGKPVYPDDYGGEYIDGSLLYVWIVHKNPMNQWKYEQLCEGSEYVRFLDAAYSLNELERLADDLMISGKDYNISGHYVDRVKNKLCMCIAPQGNESCGSKHPEWSYKETLAALTDIWKDYLDRIVFFEQEYLNLANTVNEVRQLTEFPDNTRNTELIGGAVIKAKTDGSNTIENQGTLGFCGTYYQNNIYYYAVLTAGHVVHEAQDLNLNPIRLYHTAVTPVSVFAICDTYKCGAYEYEYNNGNAQLIQNAVDSVGDYAICKKQLNSYDLTNKVKYSTGTVSIVGSTMQGWLPVGTYVSCYGGITGYHLGTVSYLNFQGWSDGVYFTGLVSVDMPGLVKRDSGGPVYSYIQVGNQAYGYNAQGTITGHTSLNMFYSPISYPISCGFSVATS